MSLTDNETFLPFLGITFFVPGDPQPGGSKRGFVNPKTGRVIITEDNKRSKPWRAVVAWFARQAYQGKPLAGPLECKMNFTLARPKYHFRTGKHAGELRPDAASWHTASPDASKLTRSTEDALKGILWADDSQVARQIITKSYGDNPGVAITVRTLL